MFGYTGNICHIDLTSRKVRLEQLDRDAARSFIGGYGINNKLAYDLTVPGVDPLSPENTIIIGAGPFGGTVVPGSSRIMLTTKFPVTGFYAAATAGGRFGSMLKQAGYDHVVITGKSDQPVYLKLGSVVEVCDAGQLWGKDTFATTDLLWHQHDPCGVIALGVAGENLAGISFALVDKVSTLGKGGLGAVMGSKNLKAIVASGARGIKVAQPERFARAVLPLIEKMRNDHIREWWTREGIMTGWRIYADNEHLCQNLSRLFPREKMEKLYDPNIYLEKYKKGPLACLSCPYADKQVIEIKEGKYAGLVTYSTSYFNPVFFFGARCDISDPAEQIVLCDLANKYGLDITSTTGVINLAIDLYQRGILTRADTDGLELRYDFETISKLMDKIAHREGFGDVLADGKLTAVKRIGRGSEKYAVHLKGMDYLLDGRNVLSPEVFGQVVNARGHQIAAESITIQQVPPEQIRRYNRKILVPEEAIDRILAQGLNVALQARYVEDWWAVTSSAIVCCMHPLIRWYSLDSLAELYSSLTGIEMTAAELLKAGERAFNLERALNAREGYTRKDDDFPEAWFQPLEGEKEPRLKDYYRTRPLTRDDTHRLLDDYYQDRGWDVSTGVPTGQKLIELGLENVARDLKKSGILP